MANSAAHGDSRMHILSSGLVLVARETFGRINACEERHRMLVKVSKRGRNRKQQEERKQKQRRKNTTAGCVSPKHNSQLALRQGAQSFLPLYARLNILRGTNLRNDSHARQQIGAGSRSATKDLERPASHDGGNRLRVPTTSEQCYRRQCRTSARLRH